MSRQNLEKEIWKDVEQVEGPSIGCSPRFGTVLSSLGIGTKDMSIGLFQGLTSAVRVWNKDTGWRAVNAT